ncbi:xylulokinase [Histidinibacterium aquaticum]|uniref:Carbohydrate kinase n=1 Tax=Histidinibacterium aquaticum TaxID=2613962 RepID=A0A5J5GP99_9RHOB|nr:FGGY-family carbohydrate kinase [Histidinibacterium aquaticum]KAA9009990.1 carbohydrate kinase [Histidinibacterium aquaticum]
MPSTATGPLFIGLDIGTSSVKALMGGPGGERVDSYAGRHATAREAPGMAEQHPADWMQHVEAALAQFAIHPRAGEVAAIGITSQVNTHVFCDADLVPLHPALTWQDTRPAPQAEALDARLTAEEKTAALGAPIPIDASHALSRMAWMAERHPDLWERTEHVLLPKDFAIARLTGETTGDPISAVGLVGPELRYAETVLGLVPRAPDLLPPLRDPLAVAGLVAAGPFTGVPVASGTMDAWAGMFGLGVTSEATAMYLSGTSDVIGLISSKGSGTAGIITFPEWRGITLHAGPTQSGGGSLSWLASLLRRDVSELGPLADKATIHRQSPLFLPHLDGERAPIWDPSSRGCFSGLTSSTGESEIAAAVMEGVAFSARLAMEAVEGAGDRRIEMFRHGGGGAASDTWCQIRADTLGRPLERVAEPDTGALGALVIAAVASGELADLATAAASLVATDRTFHPDPERSALADARFAAFRELYAAFGKVNRLLG